MSDVTPGRRFEEPISVKTAARFLGVSPSIVYAYVERKQIPHYRMMGRSIRFRLSELTEWFRGKGLPSPEYSRGRGYNAHRSRDFGTHKPGLVGDPGTSATVRKATGSAHGSSNKQMGGRGPTKGGHRKQAVRGGLIDA